MRFPHTPGELTAGWLGDQLGCDVRSFESEQIGVGVGLLGVLHRVHLDGDGPTTVVAKFPTTDVAARTHVVEPLRAYEKEVGYYRELAADAPVSSPEVYTAEFDAETGDFVLLLEDLGSLRTADQTVGCTAQDAAVVLTEIARHHAHHARDGGPHIRPWMGTVDDPALQQVVAGMAAQALPTFRDSFAGAVEPSLREFVDTLPETVATFMTIQKEPTTTYAHVDLRLDNIFFGGPERPVVLVDWQLSAVGGLAYDVAYFLSQSLTVDDRRQHEATLIDGYLAAVEAAGCPVDRDAFMIDYRRTVAFCAVYPINAAGQIELANDRARELVADMLDRALTAVQDHDALAVWPAG